ncbi:MAG TPA: trypsin-like peptidase domain-containing protein [Trebonia sp.]|nr:trypsin-like peptidase domain-containing protein [Trebonia sp.]
MMPQQPADGQVRSPVLVARIGSEQRVFPVGMQIRVGRDPALELVSINPLVSRDTHGLIISDEKGATYIDRSRRGTFLDGKRLRGPLRITESVTLRLGDPATGEELGITPPLSSTELEHNRDRRLRRGRARVAVIVAAGAAVSGGIAAVILTTVGTPSASGRQAGATLPVSALQHAESSTVRLLQGSQSSYTGWGSGTIISPDGLILTNAHVAEPQAPGLAVAIGEPGSQLEQDPPYLTVELTTGPSSPVKAAYRARPVAVDGYLDLAVVQIYATNGGTPVSQQSLHLPYLALGNDAAVQLDQPVTVLGFPGVADSDSISVTSGVISTFVPDPLGHVPDPRFELETTARLAHGNSGGAAVSNAGQLIGVPSLEVTGEGGDLSWRLRSVTEARTLIAAARAGTAYHSKYLVPRSGAERSGGAGIGTSQHEACAGGTSVTPSASAVFGADFSGVPSGLDLALLVELPDGSPVTDSTDGLPQLAAKSGSGCFAIQVSAEQLGLAAMPSGTYHIQLYGGPSLAPIGTATSVTVGA